MRADCVFTNARIATMDPDQPGLGVVARGMVAAVAGRIVYVGPEQKIDAAAVTDCEGRWITPGLIDCHTHLVYGGNRAAEFEARLNGASYEEIARAGGGIAATVRATRAASEQDLLCAAQKRLNALLAEGVTTVEIKSGYGLSEESELKILRVIRALGGQVDVAASFLGAHALPQEFGIDRAGYVRLLCDRLIPAVAAEGLADAVDGFCEGIAFSPDEMAQIFAAAAAHGLRVKLHADQLSNLHGAALAARFKALSADHLEYTDEAGAAAMAEAGTVAVLLPGAFYTLRETQAPADRGLARAGRSNGGGDGYQSRHLAADLPAAGDEHGGDPVPPDRGRMPARRDPQCRRRTGPRGCRRAAAGRKMPSGDLGHRESGRACLSNWF